MSSNYVFANNYLKPWPNYKEIDDWFLKLVHNKICLSGAKTFISLGPVEGEKNVVLTHLPDKIPASDGAETVEGNTKDILFTLKEENSEKDIIVVGGAEVINNTIPWANNIYICKLDIVVDGDLVLSPKVLNMVQSTFSFVDLKTVQAYGNTPKLEFYHYRRALH